MEAGTSVGVHGGGPSTLAEHPVSGLGGTESLSQELFVPWSKCNGICPTRAQVVEGRGPPTLVRSIVGRVEQKYQLFCVLEVNSNNPTVDSFTYRYSKEDKNNQDPVGDSKSIC